jgi:glycosyltransferase involved in cell wall biosynthesis
MHDAAVFEHADAYTFAFRMWYRLLFRRLGARAGALVTVSQFSQGRLARVLGVDPARLQVVHNGADHFSRIEADASVLDAYGLSPQRYVLIVGTEKRTKNIRPLLDVWCSLPRDPGQVLVWVGGGNRRVFSPSADLDKTPEELAGDAIVRTGVICDERLKALYENAAALVVPSTYEGFGFPAVEAMAAGCPVLVARSAALPEICGTAALYFEPTDLEHAGALLRRLLADEPLRRGMVDRGRARARLFSWDSVGTALALQAEVLTSRLCVAQ